MKIDSRQGSLLHILMESLICVLILLVAERVSYYFASGYVLVQLNAVYTLVSLGVARCISGVIENHLSRHQQHAKDLASQ